jgi:SHS2 domain-containing protein
MKEYGLIEHTADIGIRVKAGGLRELFMKTALAMFDIIAEPKKAKVRGIKTIKLAQHADNLEELMVNWLNELLSLSAAKGLIFTGLKIKKLRPDYLEAELKGRGIEDFKVNSEIKAATYHQLKIEKKVDTWQAEVIFDV